MYFIHGGRHLECLLRFLFLYNVLKKFEEVWRMWGGIIIISAAKSRTASASEFLPKFINYLTYLSV